MLLGGEIVICDVVKLELLHHEDRPARFRERRADLDVLASAPIDEEVYKRALAVQAALAGRGDGAHRGVKLPYYLIAAAAESAQLVMLHYDSDYETVAAITGQEHEWIAPRGSL